MLRFKPRQSKSRARFLANILHTSSLPCRENRLPRKPKSCTKQPGLPKLEPFSTPKGRDSSQMGHQRGKTVSGQRTVPRERLAMGMGGQDWGAHSGSKEKRWSARKSLTQAYCGLHLPHLVAVVEMMQKSPSDTLHGRTPTDHSKAVN